MDDGITRRSWLIGSAATGMAGLLARSAEGQAQDRVEADDYRVFFGDLHNHNSVGYAQGSLERSFDIARNHLDFFALTPHGYWHDISQYENNIEKKWLDGFDVTQRRWPEVLEMVAEYDDPGEFVAIPGYEWHSTSLGDYHILFPGLTGEYRRYDDLSEFQEFARRNGAVLIPHHPCNRLGHRGANLAHLDPRVSPVMEIYSDWGCAENDRAPYPYVRHTEGGRWTQNTYQHFLAQGHRLGAIGGTDDHLGYPGAYREGLAAVIASELSHEAIFDAIRSRRTYAVTGDRIEIDFRLNGSVMGQELPYVRQRRLDVSVAGWDQIDRIEIIKNGGVIHREFPMDREPSDASWDGPVLARFEYGWGPWPALDMTRVCDWDARLTIDGGTIEAVQTCFQSGPLDEGRRDRIVSRDDHHLRLQSFTALRQQWEDISTKAVVLRLRGGPDARLTVRLGSPTNVSLTQTLRQLSESGEMLFTGDFPKESGMLHRLVFPEHHLASYSIEDEDDGAEANWYYLRVVQCNEQLAWSSPIWVDAQ